MNQNTTLIDIVNNFMVVYVGEDKVISKAKRVDALFYAQRAMQELSYDTLKSSGSREITLPASLQMALPDDYVNYTKISWVDSAGIKHLMYPTSKTSNPSRYQIDSNDEFLFDTNGNKILSGNLITNGDFHGGSDGWVLNETNLVDGALTLQTAEVNLTALSATLGDPVKGWFYGFDGNAIGAYDAPQYWGVSQGNVPIISGEKYKITYTISGYTSGEWKWYIVDENGDISTTTVVTANGTYEETITASSSNRSYAANSVFFRNDSATVGNLVLDNVSIVRVGSENENTTWENYKSATPSENQDDYQDDTYWPMDGSRFGLDPQHAQANGSFFIDHEKIYFSSNIAGKTVILDYIGDGLGLGIESQIHKFAEEAVYKSIIYGIISTRSNTPEGLVRRYKKEKSVAIRQAKLRLSNIKLEEITQVLRGKSKQIKH